MKDKTFIPDLVIPSHLWWVCRGAIKKASLRKPRPSGGNAGFTLIEVIIVIVIIGFMVSLGAIGIYEVAKIWQSEQVRNEIGIQARNALEWMVREIREIAILDNELRIIIADRSILKFYKSGETQTIQYSLSGTTLLRTIGHTADALADYVSSLQFEYRDRKNDILMPLPLSRGKIKKIWRITIILRLTKRMQSIELKSDVFPRNVGSVILK